MSGCLPRWIQSVRIYLDYSAANPGVDQTQLLGVQHQRHQFLTAPV
jgi:hypothetical protein